MVAARDLSDYFSRLEQGLQVEWGLQMNFDRLAFGLLMALVLTGCETAGTGAPGGGKSNTAISAVRATLGQCMFPPPDISDGQSKIQSIGAVLGAAVVKSAINLGVNALGAALTEAARADVQYVSAITNVRLGQTLDDGKTCLQMVRGDYSGVTAATVAPWLAEMGLKDPQLAILNKNKMLPNSKPDFIFEATFRPAGDGKTLAIVPTFMAFAEPISSRFLRPGKDRQVALHFAFHAPGKTPEDSANPSAAINMGTLRSGSVVRFAEPMLDNGVPKSYLPVPGESQWINTDSLKGIYSITVTEWEVQEESKALGFFAALFNSVASETKTALEQLLIKSEREKVRQAAAAAELAELQVDKEKKNTAATAYTAAITARAKCIQDGLPESAQLAFAAMRNSNYTAAVAGIQLPFPNIPDLQDIDPTKNKTSCEAAIRPKP